MNDSKKKMILIAPAVFGFFSGLRSSVNTTDSWLLMAKDAILGAGTGLLFGLCVYHLMLRFYGEDNPDTDVKPTDNAVNMPVMSSQRAVSRSTSDFDYIDYVHVKKDEDETYDSSEEGSYDDKYYLVSKNV